MFERFRKRRQLSKRILALEEIRRRLEEKQEGFRKDYLDAEKRHDVDGTDVSNHFLQETFRELSWVETEQLKNEARKYDIVFPRSNKMWWWSDPDFEGVPSDAPDLLTEEGKAGAIKLIKDERRAELDERVKTWTMIITLFIGLLGAATGLLSVYYSATPQSQRPPSQQTEKPLE
ncbi:MAG: hypothetical protein IPM25_00930 [Chloracidobacterium sp.]|nr:hypothetical protein [Chloracidobacterium sp.]